MPIYEFYCAACHRIFSFFARSANTSKRPDCPQCGAAGLERRASTFAISKGRAEPPAAAGPAEALPPGFDESKLERAMESLASEAEGIDESDPRQQARLMRRLFDASGLPINASMQEAMRRLEAGEDPEAIEQELGSALEDPFGGAGEAEPRAAASASARRRRPPSVDPTLYEM